MLQFGMSWYVLLLWGWRKNYRAVLPSTLNVSRHTKLLTYSIRTLLKMDHWSLKHVKLLNVTNKINHQILCILLGYIYIIREYEQDAIYRENRTEVHWPVSLKPSEQHTVQDNSLSSHKQTSTSEESILNHIPYY